MSLATRCRIDEPDGSPLTGGLVEVEPAASRARIIALDRPGRFVQRCLLGNLRELRVDLGDGVATPAEVERVYFDPATGRCCTVRLRGASALGA